MGPTEIERALIVLCRRTGRLGMEITTEEMGAAARYRLMSESEEGNVTLTVVSRGDRDWRPEKRSSDLRSLLRRLVDDIAGRVKTLRNQARRINENGILVAKADVLENLLLDLNQLLRQPETPKNVDEI